MLYKLSARINQMWHLYVGNEWPLVDKLESDTQRLHAFTIDLDNGKHKVCRIILIKLLLILNHAKL